jgi:hypothetical protein
MGHKNRPMPSLKTWKVVPLTPGLNIKYLKSPIIHFIPSNQGAILIMGDLSSPARATFALFF